MGKEQNDPSGVTIDVYGVDATPLRVSPKPVSQAAFCAFVLLDIQSSLDTLNLALVLEFRFILL